MDQGKDRTCLSEDKRVLQCPCPTLTIPDLFYCSGTVRIASHSCAPHLTEASQGLSSFRHPHADGNRVAISMKKTVCRSTGARELQVRATSYRGKAPMACPKLSAHSPYAGTADLRPLHSPPPSFYNLRVLPGLYKYPPRVLR